MRNLPERIEFEWGWMAFSTLLGLSYLTAVQPSAVQDVLADWLIPAWAACFLVSGMAGAAGTVRSLSWRTSHRYWGLHLEGAALSMQAFSAMTLGIGSLYVWSRLSDTPDARPFPAVSVLLVLAWMAINVVRIARILSDIKTMER
jgi:hypothetical protein